MADIPISWETARQWLVALTSDLKESSTVPGALLLARKDVAIALMAGQVHNGSTFEDRLAYSPSNIALAPSKWARYEAAKPSGTPTAGQMIVRQTSGMPSKARLLDNWPETKMYGLRSTVTHGPFLDRLNRAVNIDVFRPSSVQEFTSPISGDLPLFYTTGSVTQAGLLKSILGRGTVWIRADLFTKLNPDQLSRAPSDSFFGLSIENGSMVIPVHGPGLPGLIQPRTLTLQLLENNVTTDMFSVASVKSCSITFAFFNSIATATITASSAANVTVFGSRYNLQQGQFAAAYSEGRINFAMVADGSAFPPPTAQSSQLVAVAGSSKVGAISWSIPGKLLKNKILYEAADAGGFKLVLSGDSALTLLGDELRIALGACNIVVDSGSISISGFAGKMSRRSRMIKLPQNKFVSGKTTGTGSITWYNFQVPTFYYAATASGVESLTLRMNLSFSLDRPRTVNNDRVAIEALNGGDEPWSTTTWIHEPGSAGITINIQATNSRSVWRSLGRAPAAYALKNLLLKGDEPRDVEVAGVYKEGAILSGALTMTSFLRYSLPFLPDPYVTNLELVPDAATEKTGIGYLNFFQSWSAETTSDMEIEMMTRVATPAQTLRRNTVGQNDDNQLSVIRQFESNADRRYWDPAFHKKELASGIMPDLGLGQFFHIPNGNPALNLTFHPPVLMDISTGSSQFGVTFGTGLSKAISPATVTAPSLPGLAGSFAEIEDFGISGLMLQSVQSNVRIMTLPSVHWEGVVNDIPRASYQFPYSGPTTHIAIQDGDGAVPSVKLVPIAPGEAIDALVGSFKSADRVSVAARCSLPIGMVALATMKNSLTLLPPRIRMIEFKLGGEVDPISKMKSPEFEPVHQLSFTPPGKLLIHLPGSPTEPPGPPASVDPSFSGMTTILKMGLGPNAKELIDPATNTFMSDMQNKVPLSRFDVSGYGASMFSDWKRVLGPQDSENAITNVLINVFNGRTSRAVVELHSVMAPCAVAVVKTIFIKRLNTGVVLRHESEWQATSNGFYFYKNTGIITHPGIIRGVTKVRNISDIRPPVTVDGVPLDLRNVKFDCDVQVEDGGKLRSVIGLRLDGCVLLPGAPTPDPATPKNDLSNPNAPVWYAAILRQLNLGGSIDTIVQIGTSGQMKRLTSISVKPSLDPATNKQVAVVAALGSPIFAGGGQWSFVRTQSYENYKQPYPVDLAIGVPIVKVGTHDSPNLGSITTPYAFKDPEDLLKSFPTNAYNIIHGAASHRIIFTTPEIPFVQTATKGFEAAKVWVADSFALGKSATIFPNIQDCLPVVIPDLPAGAKQLLEIDPRGGYKFEPMRLLGNVKVPQLEFPATTQLSDLERTIKSDASVQTVAQIIQTGSTLKDGVQELSKDVLDARTTISVAVNTLDNVSKMDITNIHMVTRNINTATGAVKDATRVVGRLSSDVKKIGGLLGADPDLHLPDLPGLPKVASEVQHVFGSSLSQVQKALSFLENLKFLPHFKVSMTNEWSMVMSTSMNKSDLLEKLPSPGPREIVEKIMEQFDFLISATMSLSAFLFKMHIATTIKIPTGVGPIVALGTGAFDVALGTSGVDIKLDLGFGIGVDFSVGPFSASASYTQSQTILFNDQVFGLGITACMRAHVDLVIASADLYLEAKLLVVGGDCHPKQPGKTHADHGGTTIWAYASVKIALHVSIFLVCNIGVEEEAHWDSNLNGGGCLLDDMSDLIHP